MNGVIVAYRRSATSPWMPLPKLSRSGMFRFLRLGTYHSLQFDTGGVVTDGPVARAKK